jgi:hypothetical protein
MDLHEYAQAPVIVREEIVDFGDTKFKLIGSSDTTVLQESIFLDPKRAQTRATHLGKLVSMDIGKPVVFDVQMARYILLVTVALSDDRYDEKTSTWVPREARVDESVVAGVAARNSSLFISLLGAAHKVFGLTEGSAFTEVASGNSETQDTPPS